MTREEILNVLNTNTDPLIDKKIRVYFNDVALFRLTDFGDRPEFVNGRYPLLEENEALYSDMLRAKGDWLIAIREMLVDYVNEDADNIVIDISKYRFTDYRLQTTLDAFLSSKRMDNLNMMSLYLLGKNYDGQDAESFPHHLRYATPRATRALKFLRRL